MRPQYGRTAAYLALCSLRDQFHALRASDETWEEEMDLVRQGKVDKTRDYERFMRATGDGVCNVGLLFNASSLIEVTDRVM